MTDKNGRGSETAKTADSRAAKTGEKNPRGSSAQAELGRTGGKVTTQVSMTAVRPSDGGTVGGYVRAAVAAGTLFALAGPLIGLAALMVAALLRGTVPAHIDLASTAFLLALAYLAGGPPALVTGVAMGMLAPNPRRLGAFVAAAGLGAPTAFVWTGSFDLRPSLRFHLVMAAVGAGSAVACNLLRWWRAAAWKRRSATRRPE